MKSLRTWFVLLAVVLAFAAPTQRAQAQSEKAAGGTEQVASATASKAEVDQLRKELTAQRQIIEKLEVLVERLTNAKSPTPALDGAPHLVNVNMTVPATVAVTEAPEPPVEVYQKPPEKSSAAPVTAGWNGEHFFLCPGDSH
jgi:hypothetical protein